MITDRLPYCSHCSRYTHILTDEDGRERCIRCGYWEEIVWFPTEDVNLLVHPVVSRMTFALVAALAAIGIGVFCAWAFGKF